MIIVLPLSKEIKFLISYNKNIFIIYKEINNFAFRCFYLGTVVVKVTA